MSILFLDSDILLDVILLRQPFFGASAEIVELHNLPDYSCCTAVQSLLNVHYFARKALGKETAKNAIKLLMQKITILPEDVDTITQAIASEFTDFEDAVQFFAAQKANADFIITRNIKDYRNSTIPVLTAEQFLRKIL